MSTETINLDLQRTIRLIPGYDPFADAEGCWFDEDAAALAVNFFPKYVQHMEGPIAGKPFRLEPWQEGMVANLFGWKRRDEFGREVRRYRECLVFIARKNGKSPLAAGIGLYHLFCDRERGQQNYIAASTKEQAGLLFRQCRGMIEQQPAFASRCKIFGGNAPAGQSQSIFREQTGSFLKIISSETRIGQHGKNMNLGIIDELHEQPTRDLYDTLHTATASANKPQPLMILLTTSDFEREGSICNELHDHACKVRDGIVKDQKFLPVVYEASPDDDWKSPATWAKANPNLGVSVSRTYLADECRLAQEFPIRENVFKRLHLNLRTEQDSRWIPLDKWDACTEVSDPITWRAETITRLKGATCEAALDLGSTSDISALALLFHGEGDSYIVLPYFWIPKASARKREERDRVPYTLWIRQGFISATEGTYDEVTDFSFVRKAIGDLGQYFSFFKNKETRRPEIAADRLFQGDQLITNLAEDGFEPLPFGQGFASMAAPAKKFEELVIAGLIEHGANPVLRWMVSNAAAETDAAGNVKPSKNKSTEKIDGVVALVMAIGRAMVRKEKKPSVYKKRGALFI
jgi:phage terminase large subunit-like protein